MNEDPKIIQHLSLIEDALDLIFPAELTPQFCLQQTEQEGEYDCPRLTKSAAPLRDLLNLGGKRWRALAVTLCAEAFALPLPLAAQLACLVELTHNGSLIVDDIEDSSPLRRGQPAAHITYGTDFAINIANHAYFMGTVILSNWEGSREQQLEVFHSWSRALRSLHIGQGLDIAWHREPDFWPTQAEYFTMCQMKTGALSWLAGDLVAILAGLSGNKREALGKSWQDIGVGFQILDDVKNLTTGMSGKMHADDLIEGKKSLPIILAVEKDTLVKQKMTYFLTEIRQLTGVNQENMIQEALEILNKNDVLSLARKKGIAILEGAKLSLQDLLPKGVASYRVMEFLSNLIKVMV